MSTVFEMKCSSAEAGNVPTRGVVRKIFYWKEKMDNNARSL